MKKRILNISALAAMLLLVSQNTYAQQGFGTNKPSKASAIEMKSDSKGLLIPRVALTDLNNFGPIVGNAGITPAETNSLMVYNTTTDTTANLSAGYYYWTATDTNDGTIGHWQRFMTGTDEAALALDGDVTGPLDNTTVGKIQDHDVANTAPTNNQVLTWNGSAWTPTSLTPAQITDAQNVTAGSNKVTLGGTPQGASLQPFSIDVNEANLTLSNMGGKVTNDQITPGSAGQVLVTDGTTTSWQNPVDNNTTYTGSASVHLDGTSFQREALTGDVTADRNSNVTTITNNAVTNDKIADNAVQSENILDGTIATADLADDAITEGKIATNAVTADKINPDVAGTGLSQDANGALQVDYTEVETTLADGTISATNGAITVTDGANATFKDVTLAVNIESGLEIHDDKVKLGGNLTRETTITQNGNEFTIATGGSNLNISGLDKTKVQATDATAGITDRLLAVDGNDKVKALKAAMPKFFYMPSVLVPTHDSHVETGQTDVTFDNTSLTGTINLYNIYVAQFGTPVASTNAGALPVLPIAGLDFHITYATPDVFVANSITIDPATGIMTYEVSPTADFDNGSFMNIVFSVKED